MGGIGGETLVVMRHFFVVVPVCVHVGGTVSQSCYARSR